jgi:carbon monoxide dehydrogenase subunit G
MHAVRRSRILHAPKDRVWEVLDDFGGVWKYNPGVESARIVSGPETGEDACRECVFYDGGRIEETILDYDPGTAYTVAFTDVGSYPLVSNRVDITVDELDETHSEVTITARFTPKYGPLGWLLGRVVMEHRFEKRFDAVLEGLAAHLRTGETVGEDGELVARA